MKVIKNILSAIWAIWTLIGFTVGLIIFFIPFMILVTIGGPKVIHWSHRLPNMVSKFTLAWGGIFVKQHNKKIIDGKKTYIYVSNHTSTADVFLPGKVIPSDLKYLGKIEFLKYPAFGYALRKIYIPVNRSSKEDRQRSMERMRDALHKGYSLIIFPEGTRNKTDKLLQDFRTGAARLSLESGIPIAIYTTVGATKVMPSKGLTVLPGKVDIYWEDVIDPKDYGPDEAIKMTEDIQKIVSDRLEATKG